MKTLFRVLLILVVATLIGGVMYIGVDASGSSNAPSFGDDEGRPQLPAGGEFRPDGDGDAFRPEGRDHDEGGLGFPGGVIKALVLMSIAGGIYSVIAWAGKKAKRTVTTT
ncbi:MAG: hypothetical protein JNK32_07785 [Anaerolineales bacterium]|nr:hypothetical protein [Anaerolineales bacterium]